MTNIASNEFSNKHGSGDFRPVFFSCTAAINENEINRFIAIRNPQ